MSKERELVISRINIAENGKRVLLLKVWDEASLEELKNCDFSEEKFDVLDVDLTELAGLNNDVIKEGLRVLMGQILDLHKKVILDLEGLNSIETDFIEEEIIAPLRELNNGFLLCYPDGKLVKAKRVLNIQENLPEELHVKILSDLKSYKDWESVLLTSNYWNRMARDGWVMRNIGFNLGRMDEIKPLVEAGLFALKDIRKLNLSRTGIKESALQEILESCPALEELVLVRCSSINFDNLPEAFWSGLAGLKKLNLAGTEIKELGLQKILESCPAVEELVLARCSSINFDNLPEAFWSGLAGLKKLNLSGTKIKESGLQIILEFCPALEALHLGYCGSINFTNLLASSWLGLAGLRKLYLHSTQIEGSGLQKILEFCPALEELDLHFCNSIDFTNLLASSWLGLAGLRKLDLNSTQIEESGLQKILESCPALEELDLHYCSSINFDNLLASSWSNLESLKKLNLHNTGIKESGLQKILESCPAIEKLNLRRCNELERHYRKGFSGANLEDLKKTFRRQEAGPAAEVAVVAASVVDNGAGVGLAPSSR